MTYVEVAVDAPTGPDRTFTYSVPPLMDLCPGQVVWVPLGPRVVQGVVFGLADISPVEETRAVSGLVEPQPLLAPHQLALARWVSRYYRAPLLEAAALMLPPGFRQRVVALCSRTERGEATDTASLPRGAARVLAYLQRRDAVPQDRLTQALGPSSERALRSLLAAGLVRREWRLQKPRVGPKYLPLLQLAIPLEGVEGAIQALQSRRATKQVVLLQHLASSGPLPLSQARKEFGPSAVEGLQRGGLVQIEQQRVIRDPLAGRTFAPDQSVALTAAQQEAVQQVVAALEERSDGRQAFLLQGVTGSGKTEVYLHALARCLALGKRGIFLVPEISLTPQFLARLQGRLPGRVALLHSALTPGEQFDSWWAIQRGDYGVVLGPRSALFAPQPDLGLVVIDEEHEWTYKQEDAIPRYHVREVAIKLAELCGAVVVLGSATPDVVTYHRSLRGELKLLELPCRVGPGPGGRAQALPLASVQVVDMRQELKEGNRSIFSRPLRQALEHAISVGEQAILFLNRRGAASFVQCRDCGFVLRCRRCDVTLTYHSAVERLVCHQCGERRHVPGRCPRCQGNRMRFLGLGTQRVAEEVQAVFRVPTLRWDRDATRERHAHEEVMGRFLRGEAPVLVGTQMLAKGLHLPRVTLVGVVLADVGLHMPDFRAGERAFQLLCQVAGRAGRGPAQGRVIVQTYTPEHYAIQAAAQQDYLPFYRKELAYRQEHLNPPFRRLARLLYQHTNLALCQREAVAVGERLRMERDALGMAEADILGPAPAYPARIRGRYRWQILVRAPDPGELLDRVPVPPTWAVDIDPASLV